MPWIQGFIPSPRTVSPSITPLLASQLINHEFHCWKAPLIHKLFSPQDAQVILSIPIPIRLRPDKLEWIPNSKGCFSVKAAYKQIVNQDTTSPSTNIDWKKLWKLKAPERIKMLLWRIGGNALPTRDNLMVRLDLENLGCLLCNHDFESPIHLFFSFPAAKALWFVACWGFKSDQVPLNSNLDMVNLILSPPASLCQYQDQWIVSLYMALTIEEIWRT